MPFRQRYEAERIRARLQKVVLICLDGTRFEITNKQAYLSPTIHHKSAPFFFPRATVHIHSSLMPNLVSWMQRFADEVVMPHVDAEYPEVVNGEIKDYDRELLSGTLKQMLGFHYSGIYLKIPRLRSVTKRLLNEFLRTHTAEEIEEMSFTEDDQEWRNFSILLEAIRRENIDY